MNFLSFADFEDLASHLLLSWSTEKVFMVNKNKLAKLLLLFGVMLCTESRAISLSVRDLDADEYRIAHLNWPSIYNGPVKAGIMKLEVNGMQVNAFCIDLYHFSSSEFNNYSILNLEDESKNPGGPLGNERARVIKNLWALNYEDALNNLDLAAALQVAIWEISTISIPGQKVPKITTPSFGKFKVDDLVSAATIYTGEGADLMALTGLPQDYITLRDLDEAATVPDTGTATLVLLGSGLLAVTMASHTTFYRRSLSN